jgi:hypothetical protein
MIQWKGFSRVDKGSFITKSCENQHNLPSKMQESGAEVGDKLRTDSIY